MVIYKHLHSTWSCNRLENFMVSYVGNHRLLYSKESVPKSTEYVQLNQGRKNNQENHMSVENK